MTSLGTVRYTDKNVARIIPSFGERREISTQNQVIFSGTKMISSG